MISDKPSSKTASPYHERQIRQLCAMHVLNNLFGYKAFNQAELDHICFNLSPGSWINPHKSVWGTGNYDINVIMSALQSREYEAKWFDKRKALSTLVMERIFGFILNVPSNFRILGMVPLPYYKQKHWIALKCVDGVYYNLDSNLKAPERIGMLPEFCSFLEKELSSKDKELFVVVSREEAEFQSWKRDYDAESEEPANDLKVKLPET